ncbi:hypothetical protein LIER_14924 [Lithospermum erythrorhizon]|uniref:Reverse transcriptase domain-containing protein n=1 Tax=Lithospermum erythrorhizon TaxID=34254 RepID=A0AAV3Q1V5_LITER
MASPDDSALREEVSVLRERAEFLMQAERTFFQQKARFAPVSDEEIRWAVFDIGDERAPGPDGFTAAFFKANSDIVRGDVVRAVREFYSTGRLLRPIGCANVVYKIITKILARCMERFLPSLIDRSQGAFVRGQSLVDDVFLAQRIVLGYSVTRTSSWGMLMVDLRKAYDIVSWDFLGVVLRGLDFSEAFVGWVMQCVTTTSYWVSINGELHEHFPGHRGLRQGDPMSPGLFLLYLEYFSRLCRALAASPGFSFHLMCAEVGITHIAFADDLMLFSRGDISSVDILMDCLSYLESCSGLAVSPAKSSVYLAGMRGPKRDAILARVGFREGTFPVWYLGIPLNPSKLSGGSKKAKVKFEDICAPNDEGGLGLKDVQTWNSALLVSALWSLHSDVESLWVQWFKGII